MKLKNLLFLLILTGFLGCNENPVTPDATIEERINANRPFDEIVVYHSDFTYIFSRHDEDAWERIDDAYANDGYLIVITDESLNRTFLFNLLSTKKLETRKGKITITY